MKQLHFVAHGYTHHMLSTSRDSTAKLSVDRAAYIHHQLLDKQPVSIIRRLIARDLSAVEHLGTLT